MMELYYYNLFLFCLTCCNGFLFDDLAKRFSCQGYLLTCPVMCQVTDANGCKTCGDCSFFDPSNPSLTSGGGLFNPGKSNGVNISHLPGPTSSNDLNTFHETSGTDSVWKPTAPTEATIRFTSLQEKSQYPSIHPTSQKEHSNSEQYASTMPVPTFTSLIPSTFRTDMMPATQHPYFKRQSSQSKRSK